MTRDRATQTAATSTVEQPWTVLRIILWSAEYLDGKGVDRARLDAELLLAWVLGLSRLELYLQYDRPLSSEERDRFRPLLRRRADREPLQYILGSGSFRELDLAIDTRALIPRPETEELVGAVLRWVEEFPVARDARALRALDVGTGSGCVALSLALEGPFGEVVATDISEAALELAATNAGDVGVKQLCDFRVGGLYQPVAGERFDVVVSNPPYVSDSEYETLAPEIREWEPRAALAAGHDGLDVLRPLVEGAGAHLDSGGLLALEIGAGQGDEAADLVRATGEFEEPSVREDLSGRTRMVLAERAPLS